MTRTATRPLARLLPVTALLAMGTLLAACTTDAGSATPSESAGSPAASAEPSTGTASGTAAGGSVVIQPMFTQGETGGVSRSLVTLEPSDDGSLRVDFSEDEVAGQGDQIRAAGWNAVVAATLLTGSPLEGRITFEATGYVDGPSAGALSTVAVLALLEDTDLDPSVTMTGTINPTGGIGPVGGIPAKVRGAAEEDGIETVLIPVGQRNAEDLDGSVVDVVRLGEDLGVEVIEVIDVYEAYEALTGERLLRPDGSSVPRVEGVVYDRLKAQADAAFSEADAALAQMATLDPLMQEALAPLVADAQDLLDRGRDLSQQGLQGGAFINASQATALATATYAAGQSVQLLILQGPEAVFAQYASSATAEARLFAFLDQLSSYEVENLAQAEALAAAYGNAFDALSLVLYATDLIAAIEADPAADVDVLLEQLLLPVLYFEFGDATTDFAEAVFEVGRDGDGPALADDVEAASVAQFFRRASDANYASFETTFVASQAEALGVSNGVLLGELAAVDTNVAFAVGQRAVLDGVQAYIGEANPNAAYAELGFAVSNYARNAALVEKYYSNGVLDENLAVVGVRSDLALSRNLDLSSEQLAAEISLLDDRDFVPALAVGNYERATLEARGDIVQQFDSLSSYWSSWVTLRTLAYLGGFPRDGYEG